MPTLNTINGVRDAVSMMLKRYVPMPSSGTVTATEDGKLVILAMAPGGSGAACSTGGSPRTVTGGGAGEFFTDVLDVKVGDVFLIMHGTPGALVSAQSAGVSGNDATNTSITGPNGYSVTIIGGKKGIYSTAGGSTAGGAGGASGTGGSAKAKRAPGGRGGSVTGQASGSKCATGGGAVNAIQFAQNQTTTRGGDCSATNSGIAICTGGGGVGGNGGDVFNGSGNSCTPGGGSGGNATPLVAGPNAIGDASVSSPAILLAALASYGLDFYGGGSVFGGTAPGPGGGSSASLSTANGVTAGFMAGSGACLNQGATSTDGGIPGSGAGSGGVLIDSSGVIARVQKGGNGFALFMFFAEV